MSNRWFRFVIALLALGAAGAAAFRVFQYEHRLASAAASTRAAEYAVESAANHISEIKAAVAAYVAPGQGQDVWAARVSMLLEKLRASWGELDRAAMSAGITFTAEADIFDRLEAAEERARHHARAGQTLMAGELIFTEVRELLDALRLDTARARDEITQRSDWQQVQIRREQALLTLGAAGVMAMAILVLVPAGRMTEANVSGAPEHRTAPVVAAAPAHRTASAAARPATQASSGATSPKPAIAGGGGPSAPVAPDATAGQPPRNIPIVRVGSIGPTTPVPPITLTEAAAVCTDLGRVSQSNEIGTLLERAGRVLSASGVIVWMASENRDELFPVVSSGYDERLFARIGSIRRDASNLTASAFRDGGARTSPKGCSSAAALAVPLLTPQGPIGIFSAEFRELSEVDSDRLALATIFAAQLANLLGSITATVQSAQEAKAQNA